MKRWLVVIGLCLTAGCGKPPKEPEPPKPVTVVTPTDAAAQTMPEAPQVTGFVGKWSHAWPGTEGESRRVVLEYVKNQDGRERFEFLEHPWSSKPVFVLQINSGLETQLRFQLADEAGETTDPPRTVRYFLTENQGTWTGKLIESWTETPHDVTLTRTE
jgi:hypothetical protein